MDTEESGINLVEPFTTERLEHTLVSDSPNCPEHYFERKDQIECECRNCHWGLFINPEDQIIDGKIVAAT